MRAIFLILTLVTVVASGYSIWSGYRFLRTEFPDPFILKNQYPVVEFRREQPTVPNVRLVKFRPSGWVPLGGISRAALGAVIVSEDWAFYQHKGYDPNQMREALREDWEEGAFVRGASTITQQVARNVFLSKDKNLWRKFKELFLAVEMERKLNKRRILEVYFNIAEWGPGIYGIGRASRYYFQKSPSELTAKEGAFLAMLLPSPIRYGQSFRSKRLTAYARRTVRSILNKMMQAHFISAEERDREIGFPLLFEAVPLSELQPELGLEESLHEGGPDEEISGEEN